MPPLPPEHPPRRGTRVAFPPASPLRPLAPPLPETSPDSPSVPNPAPPAPPPELPDCMPGLPLLVPQAVLEPPGPATVVTASAVTAPRMLASENTASTTGRFPTICTVFPATTIRLIIGRMTRSGPLDCTCTTGTGCTSPHQLEKVSVVELKTDTPQSNSKFPTGVSKLGSKLLGVYLNDEHAPAWHVLPPAHAVPLVAKLSAGQVGLEPVQLSAGSQMALAPAARQTKVAGLC